MQLSHHVKRTLEPIPVNHHLRSGHVLISASPGHDKTESTAFFSVLWVYNAQSMLRKAADLGHHSS